MASACSRTNARLAASSWPARSAARGNAAVDHHRGLAGAAPPPPPAAAAARPSRAARARLAAAPGSPPASAHQERQQAPSSSAAPTLLWYKTDLRLDDHPGWHKALDAAAAGGPVVPVFCFDPARYSPLVLPPGGAEALSKALASLDRSLRRRGSALVVRTGRWEEELPRLAAELGAGRVVAEEEVEAEWCQGVAAAAAALPKGVAVQLWRAPLLASHADDYRELKQCRPGVLEPLAAPDQLPPLPQAATQAVGDADGNGGGPLGMTSAQLRQLAADAYASSLHPSLLPAAAGELGGGLASSAGGSSSFSDEEGGPGRLIDRLDTPSASSAGAAAPSSTAGQPWEAELAAEIAAGEGPVLDALSRYLRHLETDAAGGSDGEEGLQAGLADAIAAFDAPATPDGCFPALFSRAVSLGVVSKRRIYAEAAAVLGQQPEQAAPEGANPLAWLGWLLTSGGGALAQQRRQRKAAAAAAAAEAKDFHEQMAAAREGRAVHGATLHHWRWRGLLTDYLYAPAAGGTGAPDAGRPAILLCHGFGAFSEHYRDNVAALAAAGYDVYAPTLPGYGRAEKPVLPYGQGLWSSFLADFVLRVVRRPVVAAGNSIGGFISASMAADQRGLCEGLVLLNSAGQIVEGYRPPATPPPVNAPPPIVVRGVSSVSRALFSFLEGDVTNQLRRVYPVRPQRADAWLGGEIMRAARDPGALGVFRSVFYLPKPRALNYLVAEAFAKPTLVLQGVKDPLNNAPVRAEELGRCCPNVQVVKLDAGHCPHDEVPELVNAEILRFIERSVLPRMAAGAAAGGRPAAVAGVEQ